MSNNPIETGIDRGQPSNTSDFVHEALFKAVMNEPTFQDSSALFNHHERKEDQLPSLTFDSGDKGPAAMARVADDPDKELEDAFKNLIRQGGRTIGGIAGAIAGIEGGPPGILAGAIAGYLGGEKSADEVVKLWDGLDKDTKRAVLHAIVEADQWIRDHVPSWLR